MSDDRLAAAGVLVIPDAFRTAAEGHTTIDKINTMVGKSRAAGAMPVVVQVPEALMTRADDISQAVQDNRLPEDLAEHYRLVHSFGGSIITVARRAGES